MIQIIPAILATSEKDYEKDITRLNQAQSLQEGWIHIDFADNEFVKNFTVGVDIIEKFPTKLHKEAHLMVKNPKEWIEKLVKAGFERIIFHIESEGDIKEIIEEIKSKGLEVGIAINPETEVEKIYPFVSTIDKVLVMSVVPGFQGQPFISEMLDKVKKLKSENVGLMVGVDGAVRDTNIKKFIEIGADFVVIGSYILKGSIEENMEHLWEVING